jgi:hypothetical protein
VCVCVCVCVQCVCVCVCSVCVCVCVTACGNALVARSLTSPMSCCRWRGDRSCRTERGHLCYRAPHTLPVRCAARAQCVSGRTVGTEEVGANAIENQKQKKKMTRNMKRHMAGCITHRRWCAPREGRTIAFPPLDLTHAPSHSPPCEIPYKHSVYLTGSGVWAATYQAAMSVPPAPERRCLQRGTNPFPSAEGTAH